MDMFKTLGSFVAGAVGGFLLYRGRKTSEPKLMIYGGILLFVSYWLGFT